MRFIHIADIHASRERLPQTLHILNTLIERCKRGDIDFILFAGDFWDSTITATKGSGFSDIISAVRELEKHTYLYFIYGTPTHEPNGSLDAFQSDRTTVIDSIQILSPEFGKEYINPLTGATACDKVTIYCIPEPRRSNYVRNSVEETNKAINDNIKGSIEGLRDFLRGYREKETSDPLFQDIKTPLIVVYHGEVKGAVYQNGVSASSPTAIPKGLLQSLNADYYALGHIHKPQEVFKNAWYSGSACPKDFGETHDGCYNLVAIENGETRVERISFGLPTFKTLDFIKHNVLTYKSGQLGDALKSIGKYSFGLNHLRILFQCTKEEKKTLNLKQLADEIKAKTNAVSVKLEPTIIDTENAPKSEVVKRKSIVEKMTEYAKEKGLKLPKHTKELLQDIQDNTLIKLAYPQHSFELLSLSLRGAIGIRDGQHKEDFELNFEKYDDGVVCLIGPNGHGKTTIIENCHPYPCMLTREGTLKENFYLKDSHRILVYRDETGLYYRISMLIDGKTKTGKAVYFVETSKDRETWTSLPETDGSLDSYKQWVDSTFGSIDVFLRTAFFAKEQTKGTPDISSTTKGERMELLSKLAGTDHLKEVSVIAREERKEVEKSAEKIEAEIDSYSRYEDIIRQNEQDITSWQNELKGQEFSVAALEKEVAELKARDAEYQKVKAVREANSALYDQYKKEFDETKPLFEKLEEAVSNMSVYDKIDSANKTVAENAPLIEELMNKSAGLNGRINNLTEKVMQKSKEESEKKLSISKIEADIKLCKSQIVKVDEVCPTCGQPISEHKKQELLSHITKSQNELSALEKELDKESKALIEIRKDLKELETERDSLADEKAKVEGSLVDLQSESQSCTDFIESVDEVYKEYSYDEAVEEHQKLSKELDDLQDKMDSIVDSEMAEDVSEKLKETEDKLQRELNRKSDLAATIKSAEKENERYRKELKSVTEKKKELKELSEKITAYLFIEDAFSNNGIPAIELRESAPEIAEITNKILSESYGNKFTVRFGSTSELKANRKANEDFNILVYDSDNDDEKTIDLVSSGERIWIKQALFYAFSIVQMNRTGFNFRTRLIDESDGSLDGALRPKYLNMVTSAHNAANSRLTVLITHSQEIKDIAQQIIEI